MKLTEYSVEIVKKDGMVYTRFSIGKRCHKALLVKAVIALGGELVKNTTRADVYELKGNCMELGLIL